jgi:ribokinase
MMRQPAHHSPDALVLTHALEKLRAREGLRIARLERTRTTVAAPLFDLAAVRRYSTVHNLELPDAAFAVVVQCVRETLDGTHRIVADAILALNAFADVYAGHGVDPRIIQALQSDSLGNRREALLRHWRTLHGALGLPQVDAPSDRALRGTTEPLVLRQLARQLIRREVSSFDSKSVVMPTTAEPQATDSVTRPRGRVIVVGGAVMDATFQTKVLPQKETSSEAYDFHLSPGGKGLGQAIAAARLGLDVALIAAVADDRFGREILLYLKSEGVDTSLVKVVNDAHTPFTGVIEFELGDSIAVNWRNEKEVRLDVRDVERLSDHLIECDAVLVTFELPRETVHRTLMLVHQAVGTRPLVIVTPGQPYQDTGISGQALAQIDYLVAQAWELGRYAPPEPGAFDLDAAARRVLALGVETLCVPTAGGCSIYSETPLGTFSVPTFPSIYKESSAARDAFCAALSAKLIDNERQFSEQVALWATAAMAAATADYPLPNAMPDRRRIEQLLSRSRFTVAPRDPPATGAAEEDPPAGPLLPR